MKEENPLLGGESALTGQLRNPNGYGKRRGRGGGVSPGGVRKVPGAKQKSEKVRERRVFHGG